MLTFNTRGEDGDGALGGGGRGRPPGKAVSLFDDDDHVFATMLHDPDGYTAGDTTDGGDVAGQQAFVSSALPNHSLSQGNCMPFGAAAPATAEVSNGNYTNGFLDSFCEFRQNDLPSVHQPQHEPLVGPIHHQSNTLRQDQSPMPSQTRTELFSCYGSSPGPRSVNISSSQVSPNDSAISIGINENGHGPVHAEDGTSGDYGAFPAARCGLPGPLRPDSDDPDSNGNRTAACPDLRPSSNHRLDPLIEPPISQFTADSMLTETISSTSVATTNTVHGDDDNDSEDNDDDDLQGEADTAVRTHDDDLHDGDGCANANADANAKTSTSSPKAKRRAPSSSTNKKEGKLTKKKKTRSKVVRVSHVQKWNTRLKDLLNFKEEHGHCVVPLVNPENPPLAHWVKRQRYQYKMKMAGNKSALTIERQKMLENVGFVWDAHATSWESHVAQLRQFLSTHGHGRVPSRYVENRSLGVWAKCQRRQYRLFQVGSKSNLCRERIDALESIGFVWDVRDRLDDDDDEDEEST